MKLKVCLMMITLLMFMTGCSNNTVEVTKESITNEVVAQEEIVDTVVKVDNKSNLESKESTSGLLCGDVFETDEMDYNIMGVRINEYPDGVKFLILQMEVYNKLGEEITINGFGRFELRDNEDGVYDYDMFASVDRKFEGVVMSSNKFIGELAFDITDSNTDVFQFVYWRGF